MSQNKDSVEGGLGGVLIGDLACPAAAEPSFVFVPVRELMAARVSSQRGMSLCLPLS
jgi:hypothetical protein